jgi:hypothetical protein
MYEIIQWQDKTSKFYKPLEKLILPETTKFYT